MIEQSIQNYVEPTEDQLCFALTAIKQNYPFHNLDKIIKNIYIEMFETNSSVNTISNEPSQRNDLKSHKQTKQKISKQKQLLDPFQLNQNMQKINIEIQKCSNLSQDTSTMKVDDLLEQQLFKQSVFSKKSPYIDKIKNKEVKRSRTRVSQYDVNQNQLNRFKWQRQVADSFCNRGYGINHIRAHLNDTSFNSCKTSYKNTLGAAITVSVRKLQEFIQLECRRQIVPFDRDQIRPVMARLFTCHQWMSEEQLTTTVKFIKLSFNLKSSLPTKEQSLKLYLILLKIGRHVDASLPQKTLTKESYLKIVQKYSSKKELVWTRNIDIQLCKLYIHHQRFKKVEQQLRIKYANIPANSVRGRFYRIMRMAVKKMVNEHKKYQPSLVPAFSANDQKVKIMIGAARGMETRVQILKFYIDQSNSFNTLVAAIHALNTYMDQIFGQPKKKSSGKNKQLLDMNSNYSFKQFDQHSQIKSDYLQNDYDEINFQEEIDDSKPMISIDENFLKNNQSNQNSQIYSFLKRQGYLLKVETDQDYTIAIRKSQLHSLIKKAIQQFSQSNDDFQ